MHEGRKIKERLEDSFLTIEAKDGVKNKWLKLPMHFHACIMSAGEDMEK